MIKSILVIINMKLLKAPKQDYQARCGSIEMSGEAVLAFDEKLKRFISLNLGTQQPVSHDCTDGLCIHNPHG